MRGWPGRHRVDAALRSENKQVLDARAGEYEGAMAVVRRALADLDVARAHRSEIAIPAVLRAAHERIDDALARAAAAATAVYHALFEAAGGMYHAESDPEVALWKRHMNTALTLRSQHQMSQLDDEAALRGLPLGGTAGAHARTRAAFGPHQAGVDFDVHLDASA
jgi:hypothetical protein